MTYECICKILDGAFIGNNINEEFNGQYKIDSRKIKKGDCFIAINSGTNYIEDAINKGATLIISQSCNKEFLVNRIIVNDTKKALIDLSHEIRKRYLNIPLIAITGSVGKTTTKELTSAILESKYNVLKNLENKNNLIGVPETLININNSYDICVLELGMNHLEEISRLSKLALPDLAVITNIGTSHIGYLKSKRNILKAKSEILDGMKSGILYINGDDKYLNKIRYSNIKKVGLNPKNDLIANNIITTKEHLYFNIKLNNKNYNIKFSIPNKSLIHNILLAIKIGLDYNIEIEDIIDIVNSYKPLKHRNNIIKLDNLTIIDDCYNSSLESLLGSLDMIKAYDEEKIIIVGDILELGKYSKKIHKKIGSILSKLDGKIILVGEEVKYAYKDKSVLFENNEQVISLLEKLDLTNKVVYLKGSRGMKLEEIKNYILKRYQ